MTLFDSHCHYNLPPLSDEFQKHWKNANDHGVKRTAIIGVDVETSKLAIDQSKTDSNLFPVVGCHPSHYQEELEKTVELNQSTAQQNAKLLQLIELEEKELESLISPNVVGIGETGLDYFRLPENESAESVKKIQLAAFRMHIDLAKKHSLPLVIHVRDRGDEAYTTVLSILEETKLTSPFVLHCVSGPLSYIQSAIKLGAYIGVAGNVTYKNAEHIRDLVRSTPADRILLETDAPFLPPTPYRGQTCEPWMIENTANFLANELGFDLETVYNNTNRFYDRM